MDAFNCHAVRDRDLVVMCDPFARVSDCPLGQTELGS